MGFFAEFNTWLNGVLAQYIATNTAAIARILEPAIVTLGAGAIAWARRMFGDQAGARSITPEVLVMLRVGPCLAATVKISP